MKNLIKYSLLSITPLLLFSQSAEEDNVVDERALMEKAISIEASSSNAASDRQSYIDNIDLSLIHI